MTRKKTTKRATTEGGAPRGKGSFRRLTKLFYPEVGEVRLRALPMCRRVMVAAERQLPSDILSMVEMGMEPEHTREEIDEIMESGLISMDLEDEANRKRLIDIMKGLGVPSHIVDLEESDE